MNKIILSSIVITSLLTITYASETKAWLMDIKTGERIYSKSTVPSKAKNSTKEIESLNKEIKSLKLNIATLEADNKKNIKTEAKVLNNLVKEKDIATKNAANYLTQINEGLESLVEERTQELEEKNTLLHDLANRDGMTALYNHRASLEKLNSMIQTAKRYEYKLCVIMMDIDFFKVINDTFGHQAGDIVILKIANIIKKNVRQSDVAGRYGGEEFILILHDATLQTSVELADRIRMQIASLKIPEIRNTKVTMSFGISKFDNQASCQELLREADVALYAAKEQGRNRIITSNDLH